MDIFHYVAVRLQNTPLFEATSEDPGMSRGSKGSMYNDFCRKKASNWQQKISNTLITCSENIETMRDVVPQQVVDDVVLQEDEKDVSRYSYETPFFAAECEINCPDYYYKVFKVVAVACHKMELRAEEQTRYRIRYRNKWGGADTLYDGWLLLNGLERDEFEKDCFQDMFPNWRKLNEYYRTHPELLKKCKMPVPPCSQTAKAEKDVHFDVWKVHNVNTAEDVKCANVATTVVEGTLVDEDVKAMVKKFKPNVATDTIVISHDDDSVMK